MHRALFVLEVLLEIFAYLCPRLSDSSFNSPKWLAALARTCKTFHESAMNLLWEDLDGIKPLLGCVARLRPLIYRYDRGVGLQDVEPLFEHEARQFLRHAARVRSPRILSDFSEYFHLLTAIPIETCQFPRLLALEYSVSGTLRHLPFFLPLTPRRCVLPVIHPDLKYCHGLENLSLWSSTDSADELSLLSKTICSCK
ncbi:hypothetical protein K503DRAFT_495853 [Rhizopogon vinicolor AM-OR11-026]|uniref:F-box domain-containing protein n=1 Tax=Rhizopogon vinicolor AM-OR11-026 TaxID=1314800 RepID=A0A1B7MMA5_9AGAM|nr:hypothetical protein K503DRAFT_495853 [Rhizopogon vinicolor AM-OR11-026]